MQLQQTARSATKMKLALFGGSGNGKTYTSLQLAYGLCGDWNQIALIDSDHGSSSLYSDLGPFQAVTIEPPYAPSSYFEAIDLCIDAGKQVIIIDTLSPEWSGEGGVLESLKKNGYEDALRNHRLVLNQISKAPCHIITNIRTRRKIVCVEYLMRKHPLLVELPEQQEGIEYIFTTVLQLDRKHRIHVVKDRTNILHSKLPFVPNSEVGQWLANWCCPSTPTLPPDIQEKLDSCRSVEDIHLLLSQVDLEDVSLISAFTRRRLELEGHHNPSSANTNLPKLRAV